MNKQARGDQDSPAPIAYTQVFGDAWIARATSVALRIPSAVTPIENNYLLNPMHPDFSKIRIGKAFDFRPDSRIGLK